MKLTKDCQHYNDKAKYENKVQVKITKPSVKTLLIYKYDMS